MGLFGKQKVNGRAAFWKVFSVMCRDHFSLSESWNLALAWADKKVKKNAAGILHDLRSGGSLSDVVLKYPKVFCAVEMHVVQKGEASHDLAGQLEVLSNMLYLVGPPPKAAYRDLEIEEGMNERHNSEDEGSSEPSIMADTDVQPVMHFFYHVLERALLENVNEIRIIPEANIMKVSYKTDKSISIPENFSRLPRKIYDVMIVRIKEDLKEGKDDESLEDNEKVLSVTINGADHTFVVSFYPAQDGNIIVIKTQEGDN